MYPQKHGRSQTRECPYWNTRSSDGDLVTATSYPEGMTPAKIQEPGPVIRTSNTAVRTDHTFNESTTALKSPSTSEVSPAGHASTTGSSCWYKRSLSPSSPTFVGA